KQPARGMPAISLRRRTQPPPLGGEEAPAFHDRARSRRVTAQIAECAICAHGNPPADSPDLAQLKRFTVNQQDEDSGGPRTHIRPRRPSEWSTRALKSCRRTQSSGMTASPEGH